jgi:hypothetical protein
LGALGAAMGQYNGMSGMGQFGMGGGAVWETIKSMQSILPFTRPP